MISGGDHVCIAFAGSGKTGTGVETAHRLRKPGLAMMFNRAARDDIKPRLPSGMSAMTFHSLAFQEVIEPSSGFIRKLAGELNPEDGPTLTGKLVAKELGLSQSSDSDIESVSQLAMAIIRTVGMFQISADKEPSPDHVPDDVLPLAIRQPDKSDQCDELKERLADWAKQLWTLMSRERNGFPINHDTYLKIFHLREHNVDAELWILDEYQDTAPVAEHLIRQQTGQKLFIGDPYQQIYGFRNAINALENPIRRGLPVHYLTDSFRYNHQIAGLATLILRALGEINPVRGQARDLLPANLNGHHTVICRSNLTILVRAGEALLNQRRVQIEGGIPLSTFARVESAFALFQGRPEDVKVGAMRSMASWEELKEQIFGLGDRAGDAKTLIQLIEQYQSRLPLFLSSVKASLASSSRGPDTIHFITAHKSKGRQFPMVALDEDLAPSATILRKLDYGEPLRPHETETLNLLYVALTRAELSLHLPAKLKETFKRLSDNFGSSTGDIGEHLATVQVGTPKSHESLVRQYRTQAFINAHRRTEDDSNDR